MNTKNINKENSNLFKDDKSLKKVYVPFLKTMRANLSLFFNAFDKRLSETVHNSDSIREEKRLNEQINSISIHKLNVISSCLLSVKHAFEFFEKKHFNSFAQEMTQLLTPKEMSNGLCDKNDIAIMHKQNSLIRKYEKTYIHIIFKLKQVFSYHTSESIDSKMIPISPYVVVSAFAKSIRMMHLDPQTNMIALELFEQHVLKNLEEIYQETNNYLSKNPLKSPPDRFKKKTTKENIEKIKTIDKKSLIKALSIVQNNISLKTPIDVKKAFSKQIEAIVSNEELQLASADKDSINLTTLLFQQLFFDDSLHKNIHSIITKLQVPYLKIAILDKTFLSNNLHVAKQLIELLSQSSTGWNQKDDKNNEYINFLKKQIQLILNQDKLNNDFFNEQLDSFNAYIKKHGISFSQQQKRETEKSRGRNKIQTAMKTVDALLTYKMEDKDVPPLVKSILQGPWKNLLVLLLVRHSNSSNKYLNMINFIDDLFVLFEPEGYEFILKTNIEKMCHTYMAGLRLIAYQEDEVKAKSKELTVYLINYHKSIREYAKEKSKSPIKVTDYVNTKTHEKPEPLTNTNSHNKQQAIKTPEKINVYKDLNHEDKRLIKSIDYGTWLEFKHHSGKKIQAQLSWINPKNGKFLFVNDRGLKITDRSAQQLAKDLRDKSIVLVEE